MAKKPEKPRDEERREIDPDERFSLYPMKTEEALKRLLRDEKTPARAEGKDSDED